MKTLHTNSNNAVQIARDILQSNMVSKRPILAMVKFSQWMKLNSTDEVIVFDGSDPAIGLEDFRDKTVVFCTYGEDEEYLLEDLGSYWEELLKGEWLRVAVGEWHDVT